MQAFGVYFDVVQATLTPKGPFGWSILVWGVILFTIASISVIAQLWWYIHQLEGSYRYALSFDGLEIRVNPQQLVISLKLSNTLDKPLGYNIDTNRTVIELDGQAPITQGYANTGAVIAKLKGTTFSLPHLPLPTNNPSHGKLHYELQYGLPGRPSFKQVREIELEVWHEDIPKIKWRNYHIRWWNIYQDDRTIKKRVLRNEGSQTE